MNAWRMHIWRVSLVVAIATSAMASAGDPRKEAIDRIVEPFLKDRPYVGLVIGLIDEDAEHIYSYGKVKIGDVEKAPDEKTIFEIGSITKAFTGTLLAELVLTKKVKLDEPAQTYLPPSIKLPRRDDRDMTLLNLATHTSSLPVEPPYIGLFALTKAPDGGQNPYKHYTIKDLANTLERLTLKRPIGSESKYSNLGVGILGHALAGAMKTESYEQLLTERVLTPLKMGDTRIRMTDTLTKRKPDGYDKKGKRVSGWDFACLEACGGIRSTVADMLRFARAAMGSDTPLKAAFAFAEQPWREERLPNRSTGLCWVRNEPPQKPVVIWHNGGTGGYRSYLGLIPDRRCAVVVLSNSDHSVDELGVSLLEHLTSEK